MELIWNVYIEDFNSNCIKTYNIFDHYSFKQDLLKIYDEYKDNKNEFLIKLQRSLQYYYWSKCEWEIILSNWPPSRKFNDKKVSVYDQLVLNWNVFTEYVWNNRDSINSK